MEAPTMMWWWGNNDHMGAAGWAGMAFMIIFWIAAIIGIIYLIRYVAVSRPSGALGTSHRDRRRCSRNPTRFGRLRIGTREATSAGTSSFSGAMISWEIPGRREAWT
jgi:Na+-driven multidrug efflux pump